MHDYLRNIVSTHATGLATIQVPTGAGKSYEVAKLIKEMADDPDEHRKIIYLTSKTWKRCMEMTRSSFNRKYCDSGQIVTKWKKNC